MKEKKIKLSNNSYLRSCRVKNSFEYKHSSAAHCESIMHPFGDRVQNMKKAKNTNKHTRNKTRVEFSGSGVMGNVEAWESIFEVV